MAAASVELDGGKWILTLGIEFTHYELRLMAS